MKAKLLLSSALALGMSISGMAQAADYMIDTNGAHASINFKVSHLGYSFILGRFDTFTGSFQYDESNPAASSVNVEIDTASVNTNHGARDNHLRGEDFLSVEDFPKASFVSKSAKPTANGGLTLEGDLTLRGVTKAVTLAIDHIGGGDDPWGGHRQGFMGTTTIAMKDFGIPTNLGPAAQNVELTMVVEGVRQ